MFANAVLIRVVGLPLAIALFAACANNGVGLEGPPPPEPVAAMSSPIVPPDESELDLAGFIKTLQTVSVSVEQVGTSPPEFFSVPAKGITINGAYVAVFEYSDSIKARAEVAYVSPNGGQIAVPNGPVSQIEWVATPHFYQRGQLVVQYIGDESEVLSALEAALGSPFAAGSSSHFLPPAGEKPTLSRRKDGIRKNTLSRPGQMLPAQSTK